MTFEGLPSYETNDPLGWGGDPQRGAALGRTPIHRNFGGVQDPDFAGKLVLRRVRLSGDYDRLGTYWGSRNPGHALYWYASADGTIDVVIDVVGGRLAAKKMIWDVYPNARFYR